MGLIQTKAEPWLRISTEYASPPSPPTDQLLFGKEQLIGHKKAESIQIDKLKSKLIIILQ